MSFNLRLKSSIKPRKSQFRIEILINNSLNNIIHNYLLFPELDEPLALDETRAGRLAEDHHRHAPVEGQPAELEDARQLVLGHLVVGKAVEGGEDAPHHPLHGDVGLRLAVWKVESAGNGNAHLRKTTSRHSCSRSAHLGM